MKILAILVLAVTVAAAGFVLYEVRAMNLEVVATGIDAVPEAEAADYLAMIHTGVRTGTFGGRVFRDGEYDGEHLVHYHVRVANRSLMPAEWISVRIVPQEGDILEVLEEEPRVLSARSTGDLLTRVVSTSESTARDLVIEYWMLGRQRSLTVTLTE